MQLKKIKIKIEPIYCAMEMQQWKCSLKMEVAL